jgi:Leu/Phe-tRNA-protein transferase
MKETFEDVRGIYLDSGTSLFETLATLSAEEASQPVSDHCASLAAQVKHVIFYIRTTERYMLTTDDFRVDWDEVWRTTRAVSPAEWQALQSELKTVFTELQQIIDGIEVWDADRPLGGIFTILLHTAFHLGQIREAMCVLKSS